MKNKKIHSYFRSGKTDGGSPKIQGEKEKAERKKTVWCERSFFIAFLVEGNAKCRDRK